MPKFLSDEEMQAKAPAAAKPKFISDEQMGAHELPASIMTPLKEEMHPAFGTLERAVVKNLSNNPEASVAYLKERHPELEIKHQGGRILARAQGEKEYRPLDPDTGIDLTSMEGLKELGRDALDIGYDVPAGIAQGAAGTAGAIAGGVPTGGTGALPAAAAASGAAGAGLETLRQGLGKMAGIPQDMNWGDVGLSGAAGAATPLAFGGGATAKAVKAAAPELTAEALQAVLQGGKGALGRAKDFLFGKVLPIYGQMAGGIPKETTQTLRDSLPQIKKMEETGVTDAVENVHGRIVGNLAQLKQGVGKELENAITQSGKSVDVAKIKAPLEQAISQAKSDASELSNKGTEQRVKDLEQIYADLFSGSGGTRVAGMSEPLANSAIGVPNKITPKAAFNLQEQLADLGDLWKTGQGPQSRFGAGATRSEKKTAETMRQAYNVVNDELDQATDGLSPQLKAKYRDYSILQKDLQPLFKTPEKTFNTLSSLQKSNKRMLFEKLQNLETEHGIPLMDDARNLEAFRVYSNPALLGQSGLGSTSTSRTVPMSVLGGTLGSLIGYKAGGGYAGAAAGGAAGKLAGDYLGSPALIRNMIEMEAAAARAAQKAQPVTRPSLMGANRSIWQALQEQDE